MYQFSFKLALLSFCFVIYATVSQAQIIAFPTAEGAGKFTTGGRGTTSTLTTVFEVTNLNDAGAGSLRDALTQAATYRTIVFRVSGTIHLTAKLIIPANTTIAGQTAPGDGICLADHQVQVSGSNVIVRFIRFRMGDQYQNKGMVAGSGDEDAFDGVGPGNLIIDHCTMSWSNDEDFTFYDGNNVTLQWNFIEEPLDYSYHFEKNDVDYERHGYAGIQGGNMVTIHHNLFAHARSRNPRFNGNRTGVRDSVDFRNNIIYNWGGIDNNGGNTVYGGEGGAYNVVNNYYKYGPSTGTSSTQGVSLRYRVLNPYKQTSAPVLPYGRFYMTGNYVDGSSTITDDNWMGAVMDAGVKSDTSLAKVNTEFSIMPVNTQAATNAYATVLQKSGATLPKRDTLDQRIANDVLNRTGRIIDVQGGYPHGTAYASTVNAWPTLNSLTAPTDSDHDGMPDNWELKRGLNPNNAADRGSINTNGYTNLENYLNGDSAVATNAVNSCVSTKTLLSANGGTWLQAYDSSYAIVNSVDTTNLVASILDNTSMGTFNVSYYLTSSSRVYNGKSYLGRNITITNSGSITGPVTVRIYFTKSEFNGDLSTLQILHTNDNSCVTAINGTADVIVPSAYGTFGTYGDGYYLEFTTSVFGTFFIYTSTATIVTSGTLTAFSQTIGSPSASQTYTVSGFNLTDNISITPPAGYQLSTDGTTWYDNTSPLVLMQSGGLVANTTVSIRLNASVAGNYSGNIVHTSNGAATVNVAVNGTATTVAPSVVLQLWPFTTDNQDNATVRSSGVTASTPTLTNMTVSNGQVSAQTSAAVAPYSNNFGQAIAPTAAGLWTVAAGGPGGTLNRRNYEQFTVTATSNGVRVDSLVFSAAFVYTASNIRMAVVYSKNGFSAPADSTEITGGSAYNGAALSLAANGNFSNAFALTQQNSGPVSPINYMYHLALAGSTGVTIPAGQTLTIRLYFSCGSGTDGKYLTMRDFAVKGAVLSSALPLHLLTFNGILNSDKVNLSWLTANEEDVKQYNIERSGNGASFSKIGAVNAMNRTQNNYLFTDASPVKGKSFYRLQMMDNDGSFSYSKIIVINNADSKALQLFPDPASDMVTLLHAKAGSGAVLRVVTSDGRVAEQQAVVQGTSQTNINVSSLSKGVYQLIYTNNKVSTTTNFLKQ